MNLLKHIKRIILFFLVVSIPSIVWLLAIPLLPSTNSEYTSIFFGLVLIVSIITAICNYKFSLYPFDESDNWENDFSNAFRVLILLATTILFILFWVKTFNLLSHCSVDFSEEGLIKVAQLASPQELFPISIYLSLALSSVLILPKILFRLYFALTTTCETLKGWWTLCFINIPLYPLYLILDILSIYILDPCFDIGLSGYIYGKETPDTIITTDCGYTTEKINEDYKVKIGSKTLDVTTTREVRHHYSDTRENHVLSGKCFSILTRITYLYIRKDYFPTTHS